MPPGWYADPAQAGLLRWWDGQQWGLQTAPDPTFFSAPAPPPPFYQPAFGPMPDPAQDLAREASAGRRAGVGVLVAAAFYPLALVLSAENFHRIFAELRDYFRALDAAPLGSSVPAPHFSTTGASLALDLIQLAMLAVGVLFLIWFHRSATTAQRLGLPATHSPSWAVLGFIVPIVNLWFPYQSMRDVFPPGHPARSTVKLWWACWLGMGWSQLPVVIAAWWSASAAITFALVGAVLCIVAAFKARDLIVASHACHTALVRGERPF